MKKFLCSTVATAGLAAGLIAFAPTANAEPGWCGALPETQSALFPQRCGPQPPPPPPMKKKPYHKCGWNEHWYDPQDNCYEPGKP